jgi:heavy metal translocating P-type ATPase
MPIPKKLQFLLSLDVFIWIVLAATLIIVYFKIIPNLTEIFLIIIAFCATIPVFFSAIKSLKNKRISIDLLASIALTVSLIEKEWTSVIFINLMITSARIFSNYTQARSKRAIEHLLKLKPQKAKIKTDGGFNEVPVEEVKKGDLILVELGDRIPVDGIIEEGEAEVDQSSLTGESLLIFKKKGNEVFSSTIVSSGNLIIRAEKVGKETTFEKIIDLVENAQKNKAPISRLSDKFSTWYIIFTIIGSFLLYIISRNTILVLSLLLVSCADDVAVAVPMAFLSSITHSARHGAVIKGGEFIEALTKLKVVIVDKTGTLTRGKLKVENVFVFDDRKPEDVLELAGSISLMCKHPISQAITEHVKEKNIPIFEPDNFVEYSGRGVTAVYKNKRISCGKVSFFEELNIKITPEQLKAIDGEKEKIFNTTLIGLDNEIVGFITLSDEVRPKIKETISELKGLGVEKVVMLTGDNEKIARMVADAVGIDEFYANLLPEDKLTYLKKYLSKKYKTAMIGDGVNDAAALSLADVGIAMGAIGTDAAIESADIALMRDDLTQLPELIKIGKSTLKVVYQNLFLWATLNIIGFILVFTKILGPDGAAAYNFIFDFLPILNSLRLFR